jgi:hypothetical protein
MGNKGRGEYKINYHQFRNLIVIRHFALLVDLINKNTREQPIDCLLVLGSLFSGQKVAECQMHNECLSECTRAVASYLPKFEIRLLLLYLPKK